MNDSHTGPQAIDAPETDSDTNDDTVSRLLRVAGTRPEVPANDMAMAKAAAHAEWRQTVRTERQRNRFRRGGFGLLAAAALLALALGTSRGRALLSLDAANPITTVVATIEAITDTDTLASGPDGLAVGAELMADTWIETPAASDAGESDGAPARVALRLASGASVRLDSGTRLRLGTRDRMTLDRGAVYVDAGPGDATSVAIETAFGVARDIGTQFEVRLLGTNTDSTVADRIRIRVREGEVVLDRKSDSVSARAGNEVAVDTDGTVIHSTVATHGDAWAWVDTIRASFDPESHSILAFLEWMTREKGWTLRFAEPDLASRIDAIKPYGTLDGLTIEAAAEAWLAGAGLGYRLEGGVFEVRTLGG